MSDATQIPTLDEIYQAKKDVKDINTFATSTTLAFVDSKGRGRKTVDGVITQAEADFAAAIAGTGWFPAPGSFEAGGNISHRNQYLQLTTTVGGDNAGGYTWGGPLPKIVPPGSTPATTGGQSPGAWVWRSDTTVRSDLANGTAPIGNAKASDLAKATINVPNLKALASIPVGERRTDIVYFPLEFCNGTGLGAFGVRWKPLGVYTATTIGKVYSDSALNAWNGNASNLSALYGSFSGIGCWERVVKPTYNFYEFGGLQCDPNDLSSSYDINLVATVLKNNSITDIDMTSNSHWLIRNDVEVYQKMKWCGDDSYSANIYCEFPTTGKRFFTSPENTVYLGVTLTGFTIHRTGPNAEHGILIDSQDGLKIDVKVVGSGAAPSGGAFGGAVGVSAFYPENRPSKNVNVRVITEGSGNYGVQFGNVDTGEMEVISRLGHREVIGIEPYALSKLDLTSITSNQITWNNHGMTDGHPVLYSRQGQTQITGLVNGTFYFAVIVDDNTIKLAASKEQALRGQNITGIGSVTGTQLLLKCGVARNIKVKVGLLETGDVVAGGTNTGAIIVTNTSGGYTDAITISGIYSEQSNFTSGTHNIAVYGAKNVTVDDCDLFGNTVISSVGAGILVRNGTINSISDASGDITPSPAIVLDPDCIVNNVRVRGFERIGIEVTHGKCIVRNSSVKSNLSGAIGISLSSESEVRGSRAIGNIADVPFGVPFSFKQGSGNIDQNSENRFYNRINRRSQDTWFIKSVNLASSSGVVCGLVGLTFGTTTALKYSGTVTILAKNVNAGDANAARYILNIVKTSDAPHAYDITTVAATGLKDGLSASQPSFTWSVDTLDNLIATPVLDTEPNATWHFWISGDGEIDFV